MSGTWTKPTASGVNHDIAEAWKESHGDATKAFENLRDQRDESKNYYNSNLAIAADYFRAYSDSEQHGASAEKTSIGVYLELKKHGLAPKEGPGPVSPYSKLEEQYMYKGANDEAAKYPGEQQKWNTPIFGAGPLKITLGELKAAWQEAASKVPILHEAASGVKVVAGGIEGGAKAAYHGAKSIYHDIFG